jgi:FlaA1/EpsC-like NDP-sugar epimerase
MPRISKTHGDQIASPPMSADARNTMLLTNKVVLVTGASQGIGKAATIGCARHGADVAINYHGEHAGAALLVDGDALVNLQ